MNSCSGIEGSPRLLAWMRRGGDPWLGQWSLLHAFSQRRGQILLKESMIASNSLLKKETAYMSK